MLYDFSFHVNLGSAFSTHVPPINLMIAIGTTRCLEFATVHTPPALRFRTMRHLVPRNDRFPI